MSQPKGTIDVKVLGDGQTRAETGDMGGASHMAADNFMKYLATLLGGEVVDTKVQHGHEHHHGHTHGHGHDHTHQ